MVTLGLDISTTTVGYAFTKDKKILNMGFIDIKKHNSYKDKAFFVLTYLLKNSYIDDVEQILRQHKLSFGAEWEDSGTPFLTTSTTLIDSVVESISNVTGVNEVEQSTAGGTSDGRFIAPTGSEVVEIGPLNASIHKIDEAVSIEELEMLAQIYQKVMEKLLT